jgi:membrane fusion protein (multidrug efflux system)
MQFKPAVTALVTAVALASLLSGCKKEEAAPPAPLLRSASSPFNRKPSP